MISVGFKTDKGMLRNGNEDTIFVLPKEQLYIVADGVGGHNSGEIASRMAAAVIAEYVSEHPLAGAKSDKALKSYFQDCLMETNTRIFNQAILPGKTYGMATTCVLLYIRKNKAYVVNVGDSRCYLVRNGQLVQITEDHSAVFEMVKSGIITEEEADERPDKHVITRAIGGDPIVSPDFFNFEIFPEDTLMLCSDGLYEEVTNDRIADLCSRYKTMHRLTKQLVDEANKNGGKDNISVVCIRIS